MLFSAFMFLQLTVLGIGNHTGEGFFTERQREMVYYILQLLVILGFLLFALTRRRIRASRFGRTLQVGLAALLGAAALIMLFLRTPVVSVIATLIATLCLGWLGGTVYERMSEAAASGARVAAAMGLGCSAAIALQYVLQLWLQLPLLLAAAMVGASIVFAYLLSIPSGGAAPAGAMPHVSGTTRKIVFSCFIAAAFFFLVGFYTEYIHHLQVRSGYTTYNVYSWPRLMMIPCYLLFAAVGDRRQGKWVPLIALCILLAAVLNAVLSANAGAYRLNMCLYYCGIAASVSYYNLTFWRLAQQTKHPAFWAYAGRMLDSVMVLVLGALNLSALSVSVILAVDLTALAVIIVLMTIGGDFSPVQAEKTLLQHAVSEDAAIGRLREQYALTPREADVLRELVCTEDKQTAIADRLSVKVRTVQANVTSIYQKTGVSTRSGLVQIYRDALRL